MAPFRYDETTAVLHYVTRLSDGRTAAIELSGQPDGVLLSTANTTGSSAQQELVEQVHWMLGMDVDLSGFYTAVENKPELAHVREQSLGRFLRSATLFEDVIKTVLTTNTLWSATIRMNNKIIEQFGQPLEDDPTRHAFPTAEALAATSEETLRQETRLGYRAPYILSIARAAASGEIKLEELKNSDLPTLELRKKLLTLKGVGGYAAANLLLILGRGDYLPVDTWATHLVSHEWYNGEPVTARQIEDAFAEWGEWKAMAYWFREWNHRKENKDAESVA
ncbi:MAG: hypothetical protein LLG42_02690 [Chloroflexi bacterium]|nr:hypothetical protein [Chloroflexota bacterium]